MRIATIILRQIQWRLNSTTGIRSGGANWGSVEVRDYLIECSQSTQLNRRFTPERHRSLLGLYREILLQLRSARRELLWPAGCP